MKSRLIAMMALLLAIRCGSGAAAPSPMPAYFEHNGARLAFTLDLPAGKGPFPAIVAGHGSGKVTREQLTWLSSRFVGMGFAVLRFESVGQEMFYSGIVEHDASKTIAEANARMPEFQGPHGFDPVPTLNTVNTPTLWLLGMEDRSIPVPLTIANLEHLKSGGRPFEWHTYDGLGHSLGPQIWPDIERWVATFK